MDQNICEISSCETQKSEEFKNGITNGAAWYPVTGGMQDWNYIHANCFELTLEVGCTKYPNAKQLKQYWLDNKNAIIKLMNATYTGVHGFVFDLNGNPIADGIISVENIDKNITTYKTGDYWRLLEPNHEYTITASKMGYQPRTITIFIENSYRQDFVLQSI